MDYGAAFSNKIGMNRPASGQTKPAAPEKQPVVRESVSEPAGEPPAVVAKPDAPPEPGDTSNRDESMELGRELQLSTGQQDASAGGQPEPPPGHVSDSDADSDLDSSGDSDGEPDGPVGTVGPQSLRTAGYDKTSHCWLPLNIVNMVRHAIPTAKNRNDALAAYLYVTLNREPMVSDAIRILAADYSGDSEVANLQLQIDALSKSLESMMRTFKAMDTTMSQMMTMLVWLVGEKMNASIDLGQPVVSMDFLFQEHEFIRRQAANQTAEYMEYLDKQQARARYKASAAARDARRQG